MKLQRRLQEIYSTYRTACLSRKYYGYRLEKVKKYNLYLEILLAITASSAFASLKIASPAEILRSNFLFWVVPGVSAAAALLAVVKPLLAFDKEIERLTKLTTSFAELHEQLSLLVSEVYVSQDMTQQQEWQAQSLQASMVKLSSLEDIQPSRKQIERFESEVRQEIPTGSLWYPEEIGCKASNPNQNEGSEKDEVSAARLVDAIPMSGST